MNDYYEIQRLLHLYCSYMDKADFDVWGNLFANAKMIFEIDPSQPDIVFDCDPTGLAEFERSSTRFYDGKTRAMHMSTNAIIDIDSNRESASCESNIIVFHQSAMGAPIQPIATGVYQDVFVKADGSWQFAERRAKPMLIGDVSGHTMASISN